MKLSLGRKPQAHQTENQKPEKCILCRAQDSSYMLGLNPQLFFLEFHQKIYE